MIKDNKQLPGSSYVQAVPTCVAMVCVGIPFLLGVLVPIAIVSTIITKTSNLFTKDSTPNTTEPLGEPKNKLPKLTSKDPREFELIIFGATGFTGQLVAAYLAKTYGNKLKWAIAGRSQSKLEKVRQDIGMKDLSIVIADSGDVDALNALVRRTKVVITTAGPFLLYGSELLRQCAQNGTHYCDITGETDWVRIMIDKYDDVARESGAKIVPLCGHDCVPWDLSVLRLATEFQKDGDMLTEVHCYDEILASASGGTMKTVFTALANRRHYKATLGFDPLLKNNQGLKSECTLKPDVQVATTYSKEHGHMVGFFFMSMVMANCIRRSNALLEYSKKLVYYEAIVYPNVFTAINTTIGTFMLGAIIAAPPVSWLFLKLGLIPSPGQGPSSSDMDKGFLKITSYGYGRDKRANSKPIKAVFYFPTDPGYRDTARMLAESGLLLALEQEKTSKTGGIMTPAAGLGAPLVDRLCATGSSMEVVRD